MEVLFSEIDLSFIKKYLRIEEDWTEDDVELELEEFPMF